MGYVEGELGKKIQKLMDESNNRYDEGQFRNAIDLLIEAWDILPGDKYEFDESYLIVWGILDIAILIKDIDVMNKWVDKIFHSDPSRGDTGEREMWAGRVAYESGELDKAKEYFKIANKKSCGRCFGDEDKKYKSFFITI